MGGETHIDEREEQLPDQRVIRNERMRQSVSVFAPASVNLHDGVSFHTAWKGKHQIWGYLIWLGESVKQRTPLCCSCTRRVSHISQRHQRQLADVAFLLSVTARLRSRGDFMARTALKKEVEVQPVHPILAER